MCHFHWPLMIVSLVTDRICHCSLKSEKPDLLRKMLCKKMGEAYVPIIIVFGFARVT